MINKSKSILITGGGGYLGGRISEYLADQGHSILAHVYPMPKNAPEKWIEKMSSIVEGDAGDDSILNSIFKEKIDCIIHTVSLDHRITGQNPNETLKVNVGILWKLLDICASKGVEKLIYLSTQQVYGKRSSGEIIREDDLLNPTNAYGLTHKYCEDLCSLYSREKGVDTVCTRISNGFGAPVFPESNCWWLVINDFCKMALRKGEIKLVSDGSPQRDFIHIDNICKAMELFVNLTRDRRKHSVYNLGSGVTFTILELAHYVSCVCKERYGKEFPVVLPSNEISKDTNKFSNISKIKYDISRLNELGLKPKNDLNAGINEVLNFLERNTEIE